VITTSEVVKRANLCVATYCVQSLIDPQREKQAPGRQAKELLDRVRLAVSRMS
jgi:hypothetical protein